MKKIGFIDYFLDNYHANNYPKWLSNYSSGRLCVNCAWAMAENPEGGITNEEWSKKQGIRLCKTAEEVIDECDYIMVLAPSHPEMHEELCKAPLKSGKRVYVDKAFAPDLTVAKRLFDLAQQYDTPCCSSSALAFVSGYKKIDRDKIQTLSSKGGGSFEVYAIHQFEPVIHLMQCLPTAVMSIGDSMYPSFAIKFADGRIARTEQFPTGDFKISAGYTDGSSVFADSEEDIFKNFILKVINYFETGELVAEKEQTLSVIATLDAAKKALKTPFCWIKTEKID